jgi:TPR repeat protein
MSIELRSATFVACIIAVACVLGGGCSRQTDDEVSAGPPQSATPSQSYALTASQYSELERKARAGDQDAMLTLAAYFNFGKSQPRQAMPWLEMAVERGNTTAMKNLAMHLSMEGGEANCDRAEQLFERALREVTDTASRAKIRTSYDSFMRGVAAGRCGPRG